MRKDTAKSGKKSKKLIVKKRNPVLEQLNLDAAGIDIGSESHYVAVPQDRDEQAVREFKSFTEDLHAMADWLHTCQVKTIAMESTGVYWIPVYEILVERGFEVKLVDARQVKNVSGRKTDVLDCQWIQQLHTYGLLSNAFIPELSVRALRSYVRQREMLIRNMAGHIQHMQKSLTQMNIQLYNVVSDITGATGMRIIRAIIQGERDKKVLSSYRDCRCQNGEAVIEKSLVGNYREEHVFGLKQAVELYDFYKERMQACDEEIEKLLKTFESQVDLSQYEMQEVRRQSKQAQKNAPRFDGRSLLVELIGVDLTMIPGINVVTALNVLGSIGPDMSAWKSSKHFESWLGLAPGNKVSGGKRLGGRTKKSSNPAATALRIAAQALHKSTSALGSYYRRMHARIGAPKAITATARKLAGIIYNMIKFKREFVEMGQDYYEKKYHDRMVKSVMKKAAQLGLQLVSAAGKFPVSNAPI